MLSDNNNYTTETQKQLSFLGYKKGDTVYLRGFLPANHPDKNKDKGRKASCKSFTQLTKIANEWEEQGLGVYLVVNGGGHTDNDVKECRALFYEHDNLAKELQINLWQSLNLPTPTFQVDTGGKSIHSYWVLSERISPEDWKKIQTDLLNYADADRALKNPSRVMRLAGYAHSSGNKSLIISELGQLYSYNELRKIIPTTKVEIPVQDINDWGDMRKIAPYLEGYKIGGRKGWITCKCPVHNGQSEDSLHINENDGKFHCHANCDTKEIFRVSLDIAKSRGYIVPNHVYTPSYTPVNTTTKKIKSEISKADLIAELSQLIDNELPKSELEVLFPEIAERSGRASSEIRRIYDALVKEKSLEFDRLEVKNQIPEIIQAQQARLDPKELFYGDGGNFANLLQKVADAMPTSVENFITTLIPVAGSRMGTAARIIINPRGRHTEPAIFWSCVVAPTGRLKTPTQRVIISPLAKLEADEFRKWQVVKQDFEEELKRYKKNSDDDPPEQPAPRKRFLVQSATVETRIKLHSENPRGFLNYRDEWSSFINGRNKYRNGKGDDLELDLSEFNGDAILKDNSSDSLFIERSSISRTGNTQPETLRKFLAAQDYEDYTGEFARWLFCLVPGDVAYIELFKEQDNSGELLDEQLVNLYRQLSKLPEQDYFLTSGAKGVYQGYHNWMTDAQLKENHPGLGAAYPKLKSYLARLALWLHIINSVLAGEPIPSQMIEGKTMYIACSLVNFYLNQAKLLYNSFGSGSSQENHLTGELLKITEYISKHPDGCTLREIKAGIRCLKKCPTPDIEASCGTLIELKIIRFENKKYYSLEKKRQQCQQNAESITTQGVEGVDKTSTKRQQCQQNDEKNVFSVTELGKDTVEKLNSVVENKSVDAVDVLLTQRQHPQTHTGSDFQESVDAVDAFSEESKNKNEFSPGDRIKVIESGEEKEVKEVRTNGVTTTDDWYFPFIDVEKITQELPPEEVVKKMAQEILGKKREAIAFKEGDMIQPIQGRDKNKKFTVTSFTDGRVYAKPKAGMIKSFLPHEVVKL